MTDTATQLLVDNRVRIWLVSDKVISARVRGDRRIFDVRWSRSLGWSCTCQEDRCEHALAVQQVTATTAAEASP
jgi:hypothetical protein